MSMRVLLLSGALVISTATYAQQDSADLAGSVYNQIEQPATNTGTNNNGTGTGTNNNSNTNTGTTTGGTSSSTPSQATITPGALEAMKAQQMGAMVNAMVGAALMTACLAPCPRCNMPLCAMGALAFAQSGADSGYAGMSGDTHTAASAAAGKNGTGANSKKDPTGKGGFDPKYQEGLDKLAEHGYVVGDSSVTYPDGSVKTANDFSSADGMAAAGMDPASIKEAQSILDAAEAQAASQLASVSGVGVNSGGGGGSGGAYGEGDSAGGNSAGGLGAGYRGLDSDAAKRMVAGKTKLFDGEPIGVSGQNIFDMIHVAYQKKRQGRHFIETADGVSVRRPASVRPSKN